MFHKLQIIILSLALIHTTNVYAKQDNSNSVVLNNLLMIHQQIISGSSGAEDIQVNGNRLINETFNFIKNPKNKKLLETTAGQDLLRRQTLLGNYMAVKAHFEKCINDKNAKRELHSRILDSALQSMSKKDLSIYPCSTFARNSSDFINFNNQVMKTLKKGIADEAKENLRDTIKINGARALLNFKHKFDPNFRGSTKELESISKMYNIKDKNILSNYYEKIKDTPRSLSTSEIRDTLNQSINKIKSVKTPEQFLKEIQSPAGILLLTPTMREREKPITEKDVADIIKESESQILSEKKDIAEEKTTEGLVKINPFATGEMLLSHPEYAGIVCDAINKTNSNDASKAKRDHYVMIGVAVLGGALILTGVGAMAVAAGSAYLMTGTISLAATMGTGTVAGSVVAVTTAASVVAGLGSALYEGRNSYFAHQEMLQLENAFLTNNGDIKNIEEAKTAMKEFKENRTSAMISVASAGWNGLGYIKIFSLSQLSAKTFALTQMKATNKIFNTLAETKVATKVKSAMDAMGEAAMIKIDTVTYQLAKVGEATRTKILELLKDSRFTPKDLKEMLDEAYQTAKNCI